MKYRVVWTRRAEQDLLEAAEYISQYDSQTARLWYEGFIKAIATLSENALVHGLAPESSPSGVEVRQFLYRTKSRKANRALYVVQDRTVYLLTIRRPGRRLLSRKQVLDLLEGLN